MEMQAVCDACTEWEVERKRYTHRQRVNTERGLAICLVMEV